MDEIQEFDETGNGKEAQEYLIVHNVQETDNTKQQTAETTVADQQEQGLQYIYVNKVEGIIQQKEFLTKMNEYRENSLQNHENILEQKSAMSIHLLKENESINLKCEIDLQLSNKEMEKITKIHSTIKSLENNLDHLNMLTVCCAREQQEGNAGIEKLSTDIDRLKAANKAKTDGYVHIIQHFSKLEDTMKVENAEKLDKYYAMLEETKVCINKLKEAIILCQKDENNMIEADRILLATSKEIVEKQDAMFQEFTLLKTKQEDYNKAAEDEANDAVIEISKLELTSMQNTERIENLEIESDSLQTGIGNQQEYINDMSVKNDELEKTMNICTDSCSMWNKQIETGEQQLKEELEQHEEDVKFISEEKKHYEENCAAFELENQMLAECNFSREKNIYELNVEREKGNNDLLNMQSKLDESQLTLQLLLANCEKTTNELASIVQEEENKKQEELKEVEELQSELQAVNDDFENSKQNYEKLEENALKTRNKMHTSISALEHDAREKQEFTLREKQNVLENLTKALEEELALKKKECDTNVRNCKDRIKKYQEEFENVIVSETTKIADDLNKMSEALRNADLQIGEYIPANKNLKEEIKLKVTTVQQLREKLAQLQRDKELKKVAGDCSMSLSSIHTDDEYPLEKRFGNKSKQANFKRMTSTPKTQAKKSKTDDLFDTLFDTPVFHPTKPDNK